MFARSTPAGPASRRWDPIVKLTHWSVALAVLANAVVTEEGSNAHVWVGYSLAGLLTLRLIWGLIGPREARFSAFPPSPTRAIAHLRDIGAGRLVEHRSHNPLGALMVYAIWGCLAVIIGTGIGLAGLPGDSQMERRTAIADPQEVAAPARGGDDEHEGSRPGTGSQGSTGEEEEQEGPLVEIHEAAANLLYFLILLHLAGLLFESCRSGERLVAAMLPGQPRTRT